MSFSFFFAVARVGYRTKHLQVAKYKPVYCDSKVNFKPVRRVSRLLVAFGLDLLISISFQTKTR